MKTETYLNVQIRPRKHNRIKIDKCNFCGEYLPKIQDFCSHMFHNHPQFSSDYQKCEYCGKVFKILNAYRQLSHHPATCVKRNMLYHAAIKQKHFDCDQCGKVCISLGNKKRHKASNSCGKHNGSEPTMC